MQSPDAAAWAQAEDEAEKERLRRILTMPLRERLQVLEDYSRFANLLRERHLQRDAASVSP